MSSELTPLPPDIQALLQREHDRPGPDVTTADRLFARVSASIGALPGGGGNDGSDGSGGEQSADGGARGQSADSGVSAQSEGGVGAPGNVGSPSAAPPPAPAVAPSTLPPPAAIPAATGGLSGLLAKPALIAALAFAGGGVSGAIAMRSATTPAPMIERAPPKIVIVPAPAAPPRGTSEPALSPEDLESEAKPAHPTGTTTVKPVQDSSGRDVDLGKERALLATARTALAKRDGTAALAALDRHAAQFPKGRLAEERASLRVQALLLTGDRSGAQQEADAFKQKFPKSLLKGAVEKSIEEP
ncbi:MAG: hypothetical protein R3B13_07025 [Polyangiaceae bacterium]